LACGIGLRTYHDASGRPFGKDEFKRNKTSKLDKKAVKESSEI
jgi:transposase